MRINFLLIIGGIALLFIASCKNKAHKDAEVYMNKIEKTVRENTPSNTDNNQNAKAGTPENPQDLKNIPGEWVLAKRFKDENWNHKIEAEDEDGRMVPANLKR